MKNKKFQQGLTLVELIVTISIAGLLLAIGIPTFRSYKYQSELSQTADSVRDMFVMAQNLALSPEGFKTAGAKDYIFEINQGNNQVAIYQGICDANNSVPVQKNNDPATIKYISPTIPDYFSFSNNLTVCFSITSPGKIDFPVSNQTIQTTMTNSKITNGTNNKIIKVNLVSTQMSIQ